MLESGPRAPELSTSGQVAPMIVPYSAHNVCMPEKPPSDVRYLSPAQVAELLSIGLEEVLQLIHDGRLRGARLGSPARWRVEEASLQAYIDAQLEEARLMQLWRQSNSASFPEVWGSSNSHGIGPV